jgi:UDP-glucose 4-epimerase
VLRLCYYLGPLRFGTLAEYLRPPRIPTVLGFDPLFQLMHEVDAARAIVCALDGGLRGVFNVAGPQPVPLSVVIRATGRARIPVPEPLFSLISGRFGLPPLPPGALNHVKYPTVVDDAPFRQATGFAHTFDEEQTLESFRWA